MKLFTDGAAKDPLFLRYRDDDLLQEAREFIESLWEIYEEFCPDEHFASEVRHQFHQRTWEMYLACSLLENGHKLRKPKSKGPDICIDTDPPIWIEAVSVNSGDTSDRVPSDEERSDTIFPQMDGIRVISPPTEESVILRCTHALKTKSDQISRWKRDNFLPKSDPCVVAINLGAVEGADFYTYKAAMPIFCKAFFGFGSLFYNPTCSGPKSGYLPRARVAKSAGDLISCRAFLDNEVCDVAGAICSGRGIFNMREKPSDLLFIHNPTAHYAIDVGYIRVGDEWQLQGNSVKRL
jgi:hypothetical protein